ncbi:Ig-like domain-containing protein [Sulfitobacter aestuariivivens]|uniref:Ig-like domain-containing protein n=1 Tax=Sulfitobacter aestuariivivens TaxID=2766981 RepID=UPI00360F2312
MSFGQAFGTYTFNVSGVFLQVINVVMDIVENTVEWLTFTDATYSWAEIAGGVSPNTAPVATADGANVDEDGTVSGNVLSNDSDADGGVLSVVAVNGQAGNVGQQITLASGALVTLNANGTYSYVTNGAFDALNDGETAQDSFTYQISDGQGGSDQATVTITVDGATGNVAPVAVNDTAGVAEDATVSGNVLSNDSDADGGVLSVVAVNGQAGNVGQQITLASGALVTLNANGTYSYDTNGAFDALNDGETAQDSFTYQISDGQGGSDQATVTITVDGATGNVAPVAVNDTATVAEDGTIAGNVLSNDTDGNGDGLSVVSVNGQAAFVGQQITLASGALVTLNADGSYDYDPNGAFETLNTGETALDGFTYGVSDGNGGTDTASVAITVEGVSPPMVATPVLVDFETAPLGDFAGLDGVDATGLVVAAGTAITGARYAQSDGFTLVATDEDFDLNSLTLQSIDGRVRISIEAWDDGILVATQNVNVRPGRTVEVSFGPSFDSIDEVRVSANGTFNIDDIGLTILSPVGPGDVVNPIAVNDSFETSEADVVSGNVLANDDDPDGGTLSLVSVEGDDSGTVTLVSGAQVSFASDGTISYDPNGAFDALYDGQTAQDSFSYAISDGQGAPHRPLLRSISQAPAIRRFRPQRSALGLRER